MDIVGDRKFVEVPGDKLHELPPLLVQSCPHLKRIDKVMDMAASIVETEDLIADSAFQDAGSDLDRRRMDLAINLVEQYKNFMSHWQWGDAVLEWIRQCETTFGTRLELRTLLRNDVWPHAGRSSFVTLLDDKHVDTGEVELHKAVGFRLTFRQPPPIACFSNQFLFYLNETVASTAYDTWTHMAAAPVACLPPERFTFDVYTM
jgi:hypothetical protein